jgi:hypothetical protein
LIVGRAKLSGILTCTSQPLRQQKKKEACIGKPPSLAKSEVVRLTHQFGGRGLQARVRRVDVAPVDFARARLVQFATESAVETFCLLNLALKARDVDVAKLIEIAPEFFEEAIKMAEFLFYLTDRRMTAVKLA